MKRASIIVACLLSAAVVVAVMESQSFSNAVDRRVVAALQRVTGGRSDVGDIRFGWRDRSLNLEHVVVHGSGPASAPPVFLAPHVRVQLSLKALLGGGTEVADLEIDKPQIRFESGSDLMNNIRIGDLRGIRIARLRVRDGTLELKAGWNAFPGRRIPFNVDASGVQLGIENHRRRYVVNGFVRSARVAVNPAIAAEGRLTLAAEVDGDRIHLIRAEFQSSSSRLIAQGALRTTGGIHGDLTFQSHLEAAALHWPEFRTGSIDSAGTISVRDSGAWQVSGSASGQHIALSNSAYLRQPFAFRTLYRADDQGLRLYRLEGRAAPGSFAGFAELKNYALLTASGSVQNVDVQQVLRHWVPTARWAGTAAGTVHLAATLDRSNMDPTFDVDLHISPGHNGIPVEGAVLGSYSGRSDTVRLQHLELNAAGLQLTCSGTATALNVHLQSGNALDLDPLLVAIAGGRGLSPFKDNLQGTAVQFDGTVANEHVDGSVLLQHLTTGRIVWRTVRATGEVDRSQLRLTAARLEAGNVLASLAGNVSLHNWFFDPAEANADASGTIATRNVNTLYAFPYASNVHLSGMTAQFKLSGPLREPRGRVALKLDRPEVVGQKLTAASAVLELSPGVVMIPTATLTSGHSAINLSGSFNHPVSTFSTGRLALNIKTTNFPVSTKTSLPVTGSISAEGAAGFDALDSGVRLSSVSGTLKSAQLQLAETSYSDISISAKDADGRITADVSARFAGEMLQGAIAVDPMRGYAMRASVAANRLDIQTIAHVLQVDAPALNGTVAGTASIDGPLASPRVWHARISLADISLQQSVGDGSMQFHSVIPAYLEIRDGTARLNRLVLHSSDGELSMQGEIALSSGHALRLVVEGNIGLQAFELFDPNVLSSGDASVNATISGTAGRPLVNGTVGIRNGSFAVKDFPNGITGVQAQIAFNRNRATITNLTGTSGGGRINIDGFVTYGQGGPLTYNVKAAAHDMRYRYANAIGISGDSTVRLTGTTTNGLLSGDVQLSRIVVSPGMDIGNVLASSAAARQSGISGHNLWSGLQLDLHIASEPNLQISTAVARDVEAAVDVRVRGTPDRPLVFGSISADQGDVRVFGARYSINRCQITFANTTRVEPIVDLDLETQSRGIAVDITIAGTLDKLSMTYRSDPPLQPRDIIALLTVGKTPSFDPSASVGRSTTDINALQAGANTVLGQAIAPGSHGLSKLFGITNIKIDPLVQGLTNTPQSRLTVEQQISKNVTVTYVTNLAQTSEQIFRFEWSLNPQYSIVAVRDDNGEFGIDVQYKRRFH